jgi:tetratricopeptide (TPR) repeat protein
MASKNMADADLVQLWCPLSKKVPVNPVKFDDGFVYDLDALLEEAKRNDGIFNMHLVDVDLLKTNTKRLDEIQHLADRNRNSTLWKDWSERRARFLKEEKRVANLWRGHEMKKSTSTSDHHLKQKFLQMTSICKPQKKAQHLSAIESVQTYLTEKDPERALQDYNKFFADVVPTAKCYQLLGNIHKALGDHKKAYAAYYNVVKNMPEDAVKIDIYWDISELHRANGDFRKALEWNERGHSKKAKEKAKHAWKLAEAYREGQHVAKNMEVAKKYYQKWASYSRKEGAPDWQLAKICFEEGNLPESVNHLCKAAKRKHPEGVEMQTKLQKFAATELFAEI